MLSPAEGMLWRLLLLATACHQHHLGRCYSTCQVCLLLARTGTCPHVPLHATRCLLGGCYSTRQVSCRGLAMALAPACHSTPWGLISVGAIVPAKCALFVCIGYSPLHATVMPHAQAMLLDRNSLPTRFLSHASPLFPFLLPLLNETNQCSC